MKLFGNNKYDWNLYTEPQKYMANRRMFWPRGKTLGGSSSINAMIYQRGNAEDYNEWENKLGLVGWGYKHMLKCKYTDIYIYIWILLYREKLTKDFA